MNVKASAASVQWMGMGKYSEFFIDYLTSLYVNNLYVSDVSEKYENENISSCLAVF